MVAYVGARPEAPAHNLQSAIISTNVFHAFPLRVACLHLGLDPFAMGYGGRLFFGFLRTLNKQVQARTNVISGSDMFIQYELKRFGIDTNTDRFPVDINGEFKPMSIMLFIQERKSAELGAAGTVSNQVTVPTGVFPTDNDILFGRGMTYQYHPGEFGIVCAFLFDNRGAVLLPLHPLFRKC